MVSMMRARRYYGYGDPIDVTRMQNKKEALEQIRQELDTKEKDNDHTACYPTQ